METKRGVLYGYYKWRILDLLKKKGPLRVTEIENETKIKHSSLMECLKTLRSEGWLKQLGDRRYALFTYFDRYAVIKEALIDFKRRRVRELNWEDLENHPEVHRFLSREDRSVTLELASKLKIKMTNGETKYYPEIAVDRSKLQLRESRISN